jgi:hypothetical protein
LPPEVDVDVVGLVVVVEVVVGEVVFVCVVVEPVVLVPVLVVGGISEDAVEAGEEALVMVPLLLLFAMTTIATTRPTMIAIRLAISKWRLPWGRPPSGPMIRVGSSCT